MVPIILDIFSSVGSILAVVMALFTIFEMRLDRKAAYHPDILINPVSYSFSWDENGFESWLDTEHKSVENQETTYNKGIYTTNFDLHLQALGKYSFTSLPIANIGVGAAKEVIFDWDSGNTKRLVDYLQELNPDKEAFCDIGSAACVFS